MIDLVSSAPRPRHRDTNPSVRSFPITVRSSARTEQRQDLIAVEEPLELRISWNDGEGASSVVTMRTPGDDEDLATGFLYSEAIIDGTGDIASISTCHGSPNVLKIGLHRKPSRLDDSKRFGAMSSSCGVCGKSSLDALSPTVPWNLRHFTTEVSASVLSTIPTALRRSQEIFDQTGGLHASGLFTVEGDLIALREDVGRHNALDKLIGSRARLDQLPLSETILGLSGRVSYELVQKAARAGIPIIVAISAPSTLAIELANTSGITLAGFTRNGSFNLYHDEARVR